MINYLSYYINSSCTVSWMWAVHSLSACGVCCIQKVYEYVLECIGWSVLISYISGISPSTNRFCIAWPDYDCLQSHFRYTFAAAFGYVLVVNFFKYIYHYGEYMLDFTGWVLFLYKVQCCINYKTITPARARQQMSRSPVKSLSCDQYSILHR